MRAWGFHANFETVARLRKFAPGALILKKKRNSSPLIAALDAAVRGTS
jgi:hypothetical protein